MKWFKFFFKMNNLKHFIDFGEWFDYMLVWRGALANDEVVGMLSLASTRVPNLLTKSSRENSKLPTGFSRVPMPFAFSWWLSRSHENSARAKSSLEGVCSPNRLSFSHGAPTWRTFGFITLLINQARAPGPSSFADPNPDRSFYTAGQRVLQPTDHGA